MGPQESDLTQSTWQERVRRETSEAAFFILGISYGASISWVLVTFRTLKIHRLSFCGEGPILYCPLPPL